MTESDSSTSIAIIGMAGRFPKAKDCETLWKNLCEERDCVSFFSNKELESNGVNTKHLGEHYVSGRPVMPDPELFDASFFGYTPKEADVMDPQQRILLETAWQAMENAGYDSQRITDPVAVFVGSNPSSYYQNNLLPHTDFIEKFGKFDSWLLNGRDFLSTRISYKLNLKGPSLNIQTGCSTSLVAVSQACQSLLAFECDLALAGAASVNSPIKQGYTYREGGIASKDGHCRPFDSASSGTNFGDGAGIVILKRLEDAQADGDNILAVIKGFATNNDGANKAGYTAPSVDGQAEVIELAHAFADIDPRTIEYVETHGTGTPIGDPIEVAALTQAFRKGTQDSGFCALGSIKSNMGHLDTAAGMAGLIKSILILQKKQIPATIHYKQPNPSINFPQTPFYVADKLIDWKSTDHPRRAGVSAFGIGGTNAHILLEEFIPNESPRNSHKDKWNTLVFSAKTPNALNQSLNQFATFLEGNPSIDLKNTAYTLQVGRSEFTHRASLACQTVSEAIALLKDEDPNRELSRNKAIDHPRTIFMFPGQGAQKPNMGRELYESDQGYRNIVDECSQKLIDRLGLDLRSVLYPSPDQIEHSTSLITQTRITQPALFVTEYALAKFWMERGVHPDAMLGHSIGEYVAACLAGVFSLDQALALVATRGQLLQAQDPGTMLAVRKAETDVIPLLIEGVSIAALNSPTLTVVSGSHETIEDFKAKLTSLNISHNQLHTSHAFHSPMMKEAAEKFKSHLKSIELQAPQIPYLSNITGEWITANQATNPSYWAEHICKPVRFGQSLKLLLEEGNSVFLESGPGITLASLAKQQQVRNKSNTIISSLPAVNDTHSELGAIHAAMGRIWESGQNIDWSQHPSNDTLKRIPLPTYPFESKRHWISAPSPQATTHKVVAAKITDEATISSQTTPPIRDGQSAVEVKVLTILHELSGINIEDMHLDSSFFELGFDSLSLARVSLAINNEFHSSTTVRQLTEKFSTIDKLLVYLESLSPQDEVASLNKHEKQPSEDEKTKIEIQIAELNNQLIALSAKSYFPSCIQGEGTLPLSEAQREIWLACQMDEEISQTYNESHLLHLEGSLNEDALQNSLYELVCRHDILRAKFNNDGATQVITNEPEWPFEVVDLFTNDSKEESPHLYRKIEENQIKLFDLENEQLGRLFLYKIAPQKYIFQIVIHHLIADGWSWSLLLRELSSIYSELKDKGETSRPQIMQYADYLEWTELPHVVDHRNRSESYWIERFSDKPNAIQLPSDFQRTGPKHYHSGHTTFSFSQNTIERISQFCKNTHCTTFQFLLGSFNVWLHRITSQEDLIVGVPMAGHMDSILRQVEGSDQLVGHSVNMLPIRSKLSQGDTFNKVLAQTKTNILEAQEHQNISLGTLIQKIGYARDTSQLPIISVSLNIVGFDGTEIPSLKVRNETPEKKFNYFDLTIDLRKTKNSLIADCKFSTDLYKKATIDSWFDQWDHVLNQCISNSDLDIADVSLLSNSDADRILNTWNATDSKYLDNANLHSLFEHSADHSPEKNAISFGDDLVTYSQLEQKANKIANSLIEKGVKPGTLVGVCLERSSDLVASLLGVLKAGAAYVPLDPAYPTERIEYVLDNSKATALITQDNLKQTLGKLSLASLSIDGDSAYIEERSIERPQITSKPKDLAYVIYTSGSTGKPKGVQIEHQAAVNFVQSMAETPGFTSNDRLLAVTTISFDIAVLEIFVPLYRGGQIVLTSREEAINPEALQTALKQHDISVMQATPATWRMLIEAGWDGSENLKILCGGEAMPQDLAKQLLPRCLQLWNMYGPTETTVWSACCKIEDASDINIGKPIANTQLYILDKKLQPTPIGVPGELMIGGDGLARGYLGKPQMTEERFIQNPFRKNEKIYRTGDLAKFKQDGSVECLGRIDFQVKIRGFRIELGEIETILDEHPLVNRSVVVAREDSNGINRLIAFLIPISKDQTPASDELRAHLKKSLPDYMVPSQFVYQQDFKLTPNGKLDRNALEAPAITTNSLQSKDDQPQTETERTLARILEKLLNHSNFSQNDSFFAVGGHSILAVSLSRQIEATFKKKLPLATLFRTPSIRLIAQEIDSSKGTEQTCETQLPERPKGDPIPASYSQKQLWQYDQLFPEKPTYNMPAFKRIKGKLNLPALEKTLDILLDRHEVLRTTFESKSNGNPLQIISQHQPLKLLQTDLSHLSDEEKKTAVDQAIDSEAQTPFNLSCGPLARFKLLRLSEYEHILCFNVHHIIGDGISMVLLSKEIQELYQALSVGKQPSLTPLKRQYADFARWQSNQTGSQSECQCQDYWNNRFEKAPNFINLPTDFPRPQTSTFQGELVKISIPDSLTDAIIRLANSEGVSTYALLLSAFSTLLHKRTGQQGITIGTPAAGRTHPETESMIGYFAKILLLKTIEDKTVSFKELMQQTREETVNALSHQDIHLEKFTEHLNSTKSSNSSPLIQVAFFYQTETELLPLSLPGLAVEDISRHTRTSKFDLTLFADHSNGKLNLAIEYATDLFKKASIDQLAKQLIQILDTVSKQPEIKIPELSILSEKERSLILNGWNSTEAAYEAIGIHQLFEKQVLATPDAIAVHFESQSITYRTLDEQSSQLANCLRQRGAHTDTLIGIYLERSIELVVALLGVLKSGAAYVPLDPAYPSDRIGYILENAKAPLLISQSQLTSSLLNVDIPILLLDKDSEELETFPVKCPQEKSSQANHLAYVIYTSGSTGKPKGVQIEHRAVANFLQSMAKQPGLNNSDTLLAVTTISFDIAALEIFLPLISGAKIIIASRETAINPEALIEAIELHDVTVLQATPATWRMLLASQWKGHSKLKALCGGEALPKDLARDLMPKCSQLWNMYGPTETTIWSTCCKIEDPDNIHIGRPIDNTTTYILDANNQPLPVGSTGELLIGGDGLARGYLGNPELTAEKFVQSPFKDGQLLYRTGDEARYRMDGTIECLGRLDFQVKVRGFRIELGEIESVLSSHPSLENNVVIVREDIPGDQRLIAYVVPKEDSSIDQNELRNHLTSSLPKYMIPATFISIEALPLTPNGKIDRKALPSPTNTPSSQNKNNTTEEEIRKIFSEVLGFSVSSVHDNFFDIGGHSLTVLKVISLTNERFKTQLNPIELFNSPSPFTLAKKVMNTGETDSNELKHKAVPVNSENVNSILELAQLKIGQGEKEAQRRKSPKMKESWFCKNILAPLYHNKRQSLKDLLSKIILKMEGGNAYSVTMRKLFKKHYNIDIGEFTAVEFARHKLQSNTTLGRYCSIYHTAVFQNAEHPRNTISTNGIFYESNLGFTKGYDIPRVRINIGHDVWIGNGAKILYPTQNVGTGAIIAAGAVVIEDVPPYAIVAGYPAKVVRYRFSEDTIKKLLASKWWERSLQELHAAQDEFMLPLEGDQIR